MSKIVCYSCPLTYKRFALCVFAALFLFLPLLILRDIFLPGNIAAMKETRDEDFTRNTTRRYESTSRPITKSMQSSTTKPPKTGPDMVNDYYPFVDFKLMFPEIMPVIKGPRDLLLIVLVNSGSRGDIFRNRRNAIRQTWGNRANCEQLKAMNNPNLKNLRWMLVFVLGKGGNDHDKKNAEEAKQHNDMIIGDVDDNYVNNIIKYYMGQLWASTFNVNYTLKCDDDVYLRIPAIIEHLSSSGFPSRYYGGETYPGPAVFRDPRSKWGLSKKYYAEDFWPPFNAGAFIILSGDLLASLFNYVYIRKPFHTDDAYVGVAMRDLNVKCIDIPAFEIQHDMPVHLPKKTDCQIISVIAYGHSIGPESTMFLHKRIESICTATGKNISTHQC